MGLSRLFKRVKRVARSVAAVAAPFHPAAAAISMAIGPPKPRAPALPPPPPPAMSPGITFAPQKQTTSLALGGAPIRPITSIQPARAAFSRSQPRVIPAMSRVPAIAGAARSATGRITRIILASGQSISRKGVVKLVKQIGLEAAAITLAISAVEVAEIFVQESTKPRRRRGLTPAQLSNAQRVNRRVLSFAKQLGFACRATARVGK